MDLFCSIDRGQSAKKILLKQEDTSDDDDEKYGNLRDLLGGPVFKSASPLCKYDIGLGAY